MLVAARTDEGLQLFRVDAGSAGFEAEALPTLDQTRKLANLRFAGTPAQKVGADGDQSAALERAVALGIPLLPGDDSHGVAQVGLHVDRAIDILRAAGASLDWRRPI